MGFSTLVRLAFGLLAFAALARLLGPTSFGTFMLWLSTASLVTLLANFGFNTYTLREIGADPTSALTVMSEVLAAKLLLSVALLIVSACCMAFMSPDSAWVFALLLLALLADSMTDFLNVGYRATNRFGAETRIATLASAIQFVVVSASVWYFETVLSAAVAFLVSRLCVTFITWADQLQYFAQLRPSNFSKAVSRLKAATSYAYDFGLQSLLGQVDSLVLNHYVGPVAVGIHQAGMRIFMGGGQIANVLGNVFIPHLSAMNGRNESLTAEARKLQIAFFASGAIFGLVLAVGAEQIVKLLYGPEFSSLANLLPWFGLLFFIRFFAAAHGVLLTVAGKQSARAKANVFHWALIAILSTIFVPLKGNIGWLISLVVGNLALATIYFFATYRVTAQPFKTVFLLLIGLLSFIPLINSF